MGFCLPPWPPTSKKHLKTRFFSEPPDIMVDLLWERALVGRHQNSIYIEPSMGHNRRSSSAQKSRSVKRNDTGLQLASQGEFKISLFNYIGILQLYYFNPL